MILDLRRYDDFHKTGQLAQEPPLPRDPAMYPYIVPPLAPLKDPLTKKEALFSGS